MQKLLLVYYYNRNMICIFRFSFVYVSLFQLEYEDGLGNFLMLLFRIIVVYRPIRMVEGRYITSSDQRLWQCVRRRINAVVYTDTLNDFPSWLPTSKNQSFFMNNQGFHTERYFSDKIHASLIEDYFAWRHQFP